MRRTLSIVKRIMETLLHHCEGDRVELNVRTTRPLTDAERELLVQKASEVLSKDE